MLTKERIRPASAGDRPLLVLTLLAHASANRDEVGIFAMPLEFRQGGMHLAIPKGSLSAQNLGQPGSKEVVFGPSSIFVSDLQKTSATYAVPVGAEVSVLVVDVSDDIWAFCREYDPVTDSTTTILGYSHEHLSSMPEPSRLLVEVNTWLLQRTDDRTNFYIA